MLNRPSTQPSQPLTPSLNTLVVKTVMRYQYGSLIRVIPPGGRTLTGQMGQETQDGDVVIHIHSHQVEAPAQVLRDEGWQVPEIETVAGGGPVGASPEMSFAEDAKAIVDALMNDEEREA